MSRRVVVPLDRTAHAEAALRVLPEICEEGDEVILLSVAEPARQTLRGMRPGRVVRGGVRITGDEAGAFSRDYPVYAETGDQVIQGQLDELQNYLLTLATKLEGQGFKVVVIVEISEEPAKAIVDVARRVHPTFIAMVRTTDPRLGERLFGTVAQHVIRENVAPVLILPSSAN